MKRDFNLMSDVGARHMSSTDHAVNKPSAFSERERKHVKIRHDILPFRQLPDVEQIKIRPSEVDALFAQHGEIKRRYKADIDIIN